MKKTIRISVAAAGFAASGVLFAADGDVPAGRFGIGVGADFSTGKYGGTESVDTTYVPVIGRYETDRWLFKVTVPWVSISGPGTIVGGDRPIVVQSDGSVARRTESGLGDVVTSATWSAIVSEGFFLDLTGKVKWGTANKDVGLGTGKNDFSFQVDAYRTWGTLTGFGGIGYRKYGDPDGFDLRDATFASAGLSWKVAAPVTIGLSVDYRSAIVSGRDPIIEAAPFVSWKLGGNDKLQVYAVRGFTDSSVDLGGGILWAHMF